MMKFLDLLLGYLKGRAYWPVIEPFVVVAAGWIAAQLLAYQWLAAGGSLKPTVALFIGSYLSKRISIVALGVVAILLILRRPTTADAPVGSRLAVYWRAHRRLIVYRTLAVVLVVAAVFVGLRVYSTTGVSHITVRFMALDPQVTTDGAAYLVYELNRRQRNWHFDVDVRPFTTEMMTSGEANRCAADERPRLCEAEAIAQGQPFIGITSESLGGAYFAEHRGGVSVISTFDRAAYEPLSTYEYLAYSLVLQAIAIHLDLHGGGLPQDAFRERRVSHGGLFQFVPEKEALKASILAARLGPEEQALLLNRFGADYVATCAGLLNMQWLYSEPVRGNLERVFNAKLAR